jgi:hypothetical protein
MGARTRCGPPPRSAQRRWQAKRYPDEINWNECEKSLDSAIRRWSPSVVTFAFPRDLSQQLEESFETRLAKRQSARDAGVQVRLWNLSELVRRMEDSPDLKPRFFGPQQESLMLRLDRLVQAGGKLESGRDLVERVKALGEFAEQQDADFTYDVASFGPSAPQPKWDRLPFITLEVMGEQTKVRVDAWTREGAAVELPGFGFRHDEQGQAARREAVKSLARGEPAVVTTGGRLTVQPPKVMRPLMQEAAGMAGTATLHPGDPLVLEVEIEGPGGARLTRKLDIRPVPPLPGRQMAFAGYSGSVLFELNFELPEPPKVSLTVSFHAHFGPTARDNAQAAELLHAVYGHERITFRNADLLPSAGGINERFEQVRDDEMLAAMDWRKDFYADVTYIEDVLGVELPVPERVEMDDLAAVGTVADVLRTGEGSATFEQAEAFVQNPWDIPRLPRSSGSSVRLGGGPLTRSSARRSISAKPTTTCRR